MWEQPDSRAPLLAILRGAATHEESAMLVRQFIHGQLYPQLTRAWSQDRREKPANLDEPTDRRQLFADRIWMTLP